MVALELILSSIPLLGVIGLAFIGLAFDSHLRERGNREAIKYSVHKTFVFNSRDGSIDEVI